MDAARGEADVTDEQQGERSEDADYDLLTYGEASARLREEIAIAKRRLEELRKHSPVADSGLARETATTESRLKDLEAAAERHVAQQREAGDFVRFFGYDPRQTDGRPAS